jgi:hypothetical protein
MAVSIDGAGSVTGLDAVDVPVYADAAARNTAIASPVAGQIVFVTGTGSLVYNGTAWVALGAGAANFTNTATDSYSSGGIDYKYITFTGSGSLVVDQAGFADVLVVGSGAGGGNSGGGGGAGEIIDTASFYLPLGTHTITIGGGGAGGTGGATGANGNRSQLLTLLAIPGAGGGDYRKKGSQGGASAGGDGRDLGSSTVNVSIAPGITGFAGGYTQATGGSGAGAGGGFTAAGGNGIGGTAGIGGAGANNSLTNSSIGYSGGGGGGGAGTGGAASFGGGAGGNGGAAGGNGTANRGGGGGGSGGLGGGAGGSGIVIVRVVV